MPPKNQGIPFEIRIDSILGGISSGVFQGRKDQFQSSIAIDPDLPTDDTSAVKTSGLLRPSAYSTFSSAGLSGYPRWLMTTDAGSTLYAYASDGELLEYSSALTAGSELVLGTPTNGLGQGGAYYNNYVYCAVATTIARFGPLNGSPTFDNDYWVTTLSLTSLGAATYPTNRSTTLPSHPMHVHNDGKLYFGDYDDRSVTDTTRGNGLIHYIQTKYGTEQGSTNNGSTYNALDLPPGHMPTDIESWGSDLVIATIPAGGDSTIVQDKAKLFFWDTVSPSPYRVVELPDPVCTALLNQNGNLFIWSGNMNNGVRVSVYAGGYSIKQLAFFEEGFSPPAGAVAGYGNRVTWGAFTTFPENTASVYSLGYKDGKLPLSLHNVINSKAAASATAGMVTALAYVQHASFIAPRLVVGWQDPTPAYGLDKLGSTYGVSNWRSLQYHVGKPFRITELILPLSAAVAANMTLIPTIGVDDYSTTTALTTINNTNFAASERRIVYKNISHVEGSNNLTLDLRWSGTALLPVSFPIIIKGVTIQDATR